MPKKLMLTVNVITYNHEKWIAQCLESILAQRTKFDFVIRIFEDCSTDKTADICREFKEKYPNKIELHLAEVNLGIPKNPLRSYEGIKTPYFMYIEGDDFIINEKRFQMQVDALEKHKECSFCCARTKEITNDDKFIELSNYLESGIYTLNYFKEHPRVNFFSYLSTRIVRTECIKINKFFLLDSTQIFELLKQGNMLYINEVFAVYRRQENGIYAGALPLDKFKIIFDYWYEYNKLDNREFETTIAYYLFGCLWYSIHFITSFSPKGDSIIHSEAKLSPLQIAQKVKRYFIPRFILDILRIPNKIIRFIKKRCNKMKVY